MLSHFAHAHCSVARGLNTRAHLSPHSPRVFIFDSGTTDPALSTYILRAARLNSTVAHFFPHTRPPDMQVGLECLGSLVNSYLPGLRSIPRARRFILDAQARRALAITRSGAGADLPGVRRTMTGSDDDAPAARGPPLRDRARRSEARESSRAWRPADFPPPSSFIGFTVRRAQHTTRSSTTWTTTRTSLLRTSKPYVLANFGAPRSATRNHLTAPTPRAPRRAPRRSKPRSTTSTSIKAVTNSPPSSATPLNNMVTSLGRSSAEQASLALNGTSTLQSLPSS
jgi:hypothetical protein